MTFALSTLAYSMSFVHIVMNSELIRYQNDWSFPGLVHPEIIAEKTSIVL